MSSSHIKRIRLLITLTVAAILIGGTLIAIQFAKGYRPNFGQLSVRGTGLLSATSYPKSAQVFINNRLTTVTDDTLYLSPDKYEIKIVKTGFQPWIKTLPIKAELVTLTDARLFPSIPSFTPLTFYKVENPVVSPDGNKLAYVLSGSPFTEDDGIYILSLGNNLLGNQITQITNENRDYSKAVLAWSPDSGDLLAVFAENNKITASHLLNTRGMNQVKNIVDTTARLPQILSQWQDQLIRINQSSLTRLPDFMIKIASESAVNVYFSPDREKLLYTATGNQTLPENTIGANLPNINPTKEIRELQEGKTYVYDTKEGTNYLIEKATYNKDTSQPLLVKQVEQTPTPVPTKTKTPPTDPLLKQIALIKGQTEPHSTQNLSWYPTNRHLIITSNDNISIIEYDGLNLTQISSAQLAGGFATTSPDGNRLIILSNFNQNPDIYNLLSLDLK
ncbi:PD40 domain-containing protein [Candidatus Curtissbacteria bacterium]|nr:PD40 domain-containing protein [Candidatus Curtissbacteria bacterium]